MMCKKFCWIFKFQISFTTQNDTLVWFNFSSKSATNAADKKTTGKRPSLEAADVPLPVPMYFEKENETNDR